jgi:hypothetical protein
MKRMAKEQVKAMGNRIRQPGIVSCPGVLE